MTKDLKFFDATLRDGSHALKHQLDLSVIENYCRKIDDAGLDAVIVGHGNGLGASSIQIGLSKHTDGEMLSTARRNLRKTKLGVFMIPGFGTITDNLEPAIEIGVDLFKIGSHCTEADTMQQHIEYLAGKDKEVYGVLMSSHMADNSVLLEEARKIESYGARGVIFMDSAGALLPDKVAGLVSSVADRTKLKVGYHGHNNLGLSIGNTYTALENGASIVDGTLRGFGAGAGNCQLEAIVAILQRLGVRMDVNLYRLMDVAEEIIAKGLKYVKGIDGITIISGVSGVFSAFKEKVLRAAELYKLDPRDIFVELGKKKVVGGQEDMILDVAMNLCQRRRNDPNDYMVESLL